MEDYYKMDRKRPSCKPRNQNALEILKVFGQFGFRKTSMSDIAKAANISRQTVYKKFGSKEAALSWSLDTFFTEGLENCISILEEPDIDPKQAIIDINQEYLGDYIEIWQGAAHGGELVSRAQNKIRNQRDFSEELTDIVADFLFESNACPTKEKAIETAYLLKLATRGLMISCHSPSDFHAGSVKIVQALWG